MRTRVSLTSMLSWILSSNSAGKLPSSTIPHHHNLNHITLHSPIIPSSHHLSSSFHYSFIILSLSSSSSPSHHPLIILSSFSCSHLSKINTLDFLELFSPLGQNKVKTVWWRTINLLFLPYFLFPFLLKEVFPRVLFASLL